jgi:hypothetical protein
VTFTSCRPLLRERGLRGALSHQSSTLRVGGGEHPIAGKGTLKGGWALGKVVGRRIGGGITKCKLHFCSLERDKEGGH